MYLWDSNILRCHNQGDPRLSEHLLIKKHRSRKRYADLMIAAIALAGGHIVVTRNQKHFVDLLPANQLQNWIDDPPNQAGS